MECSVFGGFGIVEAPNVFGGDNSHRMTEICSQRSVNGAIKASGPRTSPSVIRQGFTVGIVWYSGSLFCWCAISPFLPLPKSPGLCMPAQRAENPTLGQIGAQGATLLQYQGIIDLPRPKMNPSAATCAMS